MSSILVFGASGPVGRFLLPLLAARGDRVVAVSRRPPITTSPACTWVQADFYGDCADIPDAETIVSVGPLDAFATWFERNAPACRRVIALSSMSATSKQDSPDPAERELAARLVASEKRLAATAQSRSAALTIFRPTLIYGAGVDRSLAPIARFARRWRIFPIPHGRCGLRQPVHAADLARACVDAVANARTFGNVYELGGGERLRFDAMLARTRAAMKRTTLPIPLPLSLLQAFTPLAPRLGIARVTTGALRRLREDLIADNTRAAADFGYAPRNFMAADVLSA